MFAGGFAGPQFTTLFDDSSVFQKTVAWVSVTPLEPTPEMNGATPSAWPVVWRVRLCPPCPSSASMYWAVIVSPLWSESIPSAAGGAEVLMIVPV